MQLRIILAILIFIVIFGFLGPWLISAKDSLLVLAGFGLIGIGISDCLIKIFSRKK